MNVPQADRAAVNLALDDEATRWGRDGAAVAAKYGDGVARIVKKMCDEAINMPVDWTRETAMDEGIAKINRHMDWAYPWLDKRARSSVVQAFIMTWK